MKKIIVALLIFVMVVSVIGCGNTPTTTAKGTTATTTIKIADNAMVIKFGHNYKEDSPAHNAALAFKNHVETASKGTMTVSIFPSMQLGSNREQLEGIQQGSIQVGLQPTSIAGNFVPQFQILDLPFMFPSEEVMWKVLDGEFGQNLFKLLENKGIHGIGYAWTGFKQITSSKPISDLSSLKGQKIRVMDSPLLIAQYTGWGTNPTPIDFGELYNALQQKVVDGEENNFWTISAQKYYEVQSDLIVSNHAPLPALYMCNKAWYDKLTSEQKKIIDDAGKICVLKDRELLGQFEKAAIQTIKDKGTKFHELTDAQIKEFQDASVAVYDWAKAQHGVELFNSLTAAIKENSK